MILATNVHFRNRGLPSAMFAPFGTREAIPMMDWNLPRPRRFLDKPQPSWFEASHFADLLYIHIYIYYICIYISWICLRFPSPPPKKKSRSTSRLDQVTSGGVERSASHHGLGHEVPHHGISWDSGDISQHVSCVHMIYSWGYPKMDGL